MKMKIPIDPSKILDPQMHWLKGYRQNIKRPLLATYIQTFGRNIAFGEKPTIWNLWSPRRELKPLVDKNLGYGIIEVSVYFPPERRINKKPEMEYLGDEEE